tara:strand:+ start:531 stop:914 length:384 start_codon:yes stop_codon:yes gene_type:complete
VETRRACSLQCSGRRERHPSAQREAEALGLVETAAVGLERAYVGHRHFVTGAARLARTRLEHLALHRLVGPRRYLDAHERESLARLHEQALGDALRQRLLEQRRADLAVLSLDGLCDRRTRGAAGLG